jgi:hypothetical protein
MMVNGPVLITLVSWIVFNTIGKPLLSLFDLRTEVRRSMILYENVSARGRGPMFWLPQKTMRLRPTSNDSRKLKINIGTCLLSSRLSH